jgi:transposase-like protein
MSRDSTVIPFRQPDAIDDPLTKLAREGSPNAGAGLAVGDGALGFWKAIEQIFPTTRHQRCWVHSKRCSEDTFRAAA